MSTKMNQAMIRRSTSFDIIIISMLTPTIVSVSVSVVVLPSPRMTTMTMTINTQLDYQGKKTINYVKM